MKPRISIIAAIGENRELGKNNALLWNIPGELARFKKITMGHPIIMGRKTFESIGRVLPGRTNIIITQNSKFKIQNAVVVYSLDEAVEKAKSEDQEEIFIIGGGQIFEQSLPITDRLYLTLVHKSFDADTFFPDHKDLFKTIIENEKKNTDEFDYEFITLEK